jgi:Ca-activated chloride channel homolog
LTVGLASLEGAAIPLQSIAIRGELVAAHALLRFAQTYRSNAAQPLEAVYTFPLPAEGAVVDFRYRCQGRELVGELQEREQAFRAYDEAVREGHGAALVELERDDVFTASVGNLLPGETVEIEVEVLLPLDFVDGRLRLKIPTLVPPRYVPGRRGGPRTGLGAADPTVLVPDADRITPETGDPDYTASLDLAVALGFPVAVESPSHPIHVDAEKGEGKSDRYRVAFAAGAVALDRDFVLKLDTKSPSKGGVVPGVLCERTGRGSGTFALSLVPDLGGERAGRRQLDVVFLLDRSGSMGGASIVEARRALAACLRQLRGGDRFEVVTFDTEIETFSGGLCPFDEASLDAVLRWVAGVEARGGTELGRALDFALPLVPGGTLVLLTDAQVGDEELIAARFTRDLARPGSLPRVLSFGIGTNVAGGLLAELARATGGAVEEIHPGESIEEKVLAQFARAVSLRVEELGIAIDGVDAGELVPSSTALTDGEPFVLLGRYAKAGRGSVALRGRLAGEPFALDVPLDLPARPAPSTLPDVLPRIWAARRIAQLERERAALGNPRRAKAVGKQIVALSLEHRVMCRETAFVVAEKRSGERRRPGAPKTVAVPVHAPAGWEMLAGRGMDRLQRNLPMANMLSGIPLRPEPAACPASPAPPPRLSAPSADVQSLGKRSFFDEDFPDWIDLASPKPAERLPAEALPADPDAIFAAQRPDGLWDDARLGRPGDERLVRATLVRLFELLALEIDTLDEDHADSIELALGALLELLDRWPGADPDLVALALQLALQLAPAGNLRQELVTRARGARLTRALRKGRLEALIDLEAAATRIRHARRWRELAPATTHLVPPL